MMYGDGYDEGWREEYRKGARDYLLWVLERRHNAMLGNVRFHGLGAHGGQLMEGLSGWQAWFRYHLHGRINRKVPDPRQGWRKMDADYQRAALQDQIDAKRAHSRVRVYQFRTREARERLAHLLSDREEV